MKIPGWPVLAFGIGCAITLLCSCATRPPVHPTLPPPVAFTPGADHLYVQLRLENGREIPAIIDTRCTGTILDHSLEPLLGPRVGKSTANFTFFKKQKAGVYHAPKMYLGGVPLSGGPWVATADLTMDQDDQPMLAIIGMDCLQNYCFQINFTDHKIHFLDPREPAVGSHALQYSVISTHHGTVPWIRTSFWSHSPQRWSIDTGCSTDIALTPQPLHEFQALTQDLFVANRTRHATNGILPETFWHVATLDFNGENCTNFVWTDAHQYDLVGLRYLSRYLTTLDFPQRTLYLEPSAAPSLASSDNLTNFMRNCFGENIYACLTNTQPFLMHMAKAHQLPGLTNSEHGSMTLNQSFDGMTNYPIAFHFVATVGKDNTRYHYTVTQSSATGPVHLQRAWRTDATGHLLEEYPLP